MGAIDGTKRLSSLNRPSRTYTPVPLWFWNDRLSHKEIRRQIADFYRHGIYGFMIHPRMGLPKDCPYLSDRFLGYVETAVEYAAELGMTVCLYDEGMYPSGSAHGQVVQSDPRFAAQALVRRAAPEGATGDPVRPGEKRIHAMKGTMDPDGTGGPAIVTFVQTRSGGTIRGIHFGEDSREPGAPPAADLMNPDAAACFIRLTHERYYRRLSRYFGSVVTAIFTDEPSLTGRGDMEGKIPWTDGMLDLCAAEGIGADDLDDLFCREDGPGGDTRERFRRVCMERLAVSFYRPIAQWCEEHGIALTGHPSQSDDIGLLRFFHIPGQDLVLRKVGPEEDRGLSGRDSTLAKCASDAALLEGKARNAVECFGCCVRNQPSVGWDLPPEDMKWYIDWMAVRGVNLLMPHAFYYSLKGRRAKERPPDVGPSQTWWKEYGRWSRYMSRVSAYLARSASAAGIAVLCGDDRLPFRVPAALYRNQMDFHYLNVRYLENRAYEIGDGRLTVGAGRFSAIVAEEPAAFPGVPLRILDELERSGIRVIHADPDTEDWLMDLSDLRLVLPDREQPDLRAAYRRYGDMTSFLLTNEGEGDIRTEMLLPAREPAVERDPVYWDPWSGTFSKGFSVRDASGGERIELILPRRESRVLFLVPSMHAAADEPKSPERTGAGPDAAGHGADGMAEWKSVIAPEGWTLTFPHGTVRLAALEPGNWDRNVGKPYFSGEGIYVADVWIDRIPEGRIRLDCGEVHDVAAVYWNGVNAGVSFWKPYRCDVTGMVKTGRNRLRIHVMNSISCRMDRVRKPSGLDGPVRIRAERSDGREA